MPQIDLTPLRKRIRRGYKRSIKKKPLPLLGTNVLQLLAMWGIAVVQPLLGVLGDNTETFLKYKITGGSILTAVLLFAFVPPMVGLAIEAALLWSRRSLFIVHHAFLGGLGVVVGLQIAKFYLGLEGVTQGVTTLLLAAVVVGLLLATKAGGEWLRLLAIVPVIAVAMFVYNTPAGRYARGANVEAFDVKTGETPIFYIMFDEFPVKAIMNRDGSIDADRFPNFARLASTSTWYRNYTTTSETTDLAVPSAMSGRYPEQKQSFTYVDHPENLFTWLGGSYDMNVSEFISQMCPPTICEKPSALPSLVVPQQETRWRDFGSEIVDVFKQRIDFTEKNEYDAVKAAAAQTDTAPVVPVSGSTTTTVAEGSDTTAEKKPKNLPFLARIQPNRWSGWVKAIPDDPSGTLNYIHLMLPHQSWVFYPDGTPYQLNQGEQFVGESDWETKVREQRMILQVQYVDLLLGEFLDRLEAIGAYDDSLIVLQADHGVSLDAGFSHRFISLDYSNAPDIVFPPLFIHAPGQTNGVISDANVENIDVLSIMADLLDTPVPWDMDGMLPEAKTGARANTKTVVLNPRPYDIDPRPEKELVYDSSDLQRQMFERIPNGASDTAYLDMLYSDTKHHALIGTSPSVAALPDCKCSLKIDDDLVGDANPLLYIRGVAKGDLKVGQWLAFIVDGKVSGLSEVFERDGKLMYATLVYLEDYGDEWSTPIVAKVSNAGELTELVSLR